MKRTIRIGSVPYLNSKPLVQGYRSLEGIAEFVFAPPARLSSLMKSGELDAALGSSIEYLRGEFEILPGVGIVSRGAVNSVLLTGEGRIEEAKTVNLDPNSLTSCTLVALWYREYLGRVPEFFRYPLGSREAENCDAELAIGDEALRRSGKYPHQLDMGGVWEAWKGHPFVYAAWLIRRGTDLGEVGPFLASAPARMANGLASLAEKASGTLGLDRDICVKYLTHSLQFHLDKDSLRGLETYLDLAARHHAWLSEIIPGFPDLGISPPIQLEFYDLQERKLTTGS